MYLDSFQYSGEIIKIPLIPIRLSRTPACTIPNLRWSVCPGCFYPVFYKGSIFALHMIALRRKKGIKSSTFVLVRVVLLSFLVHVQSKQNCKTVE